MLQMRGFDWPSRFRRMRSVSMYSVTDFGLILFLGDFFFGGGVDIDDEENEEVDDMDFAESYLDESSTLVISEAGLGIGVGFGGGDSTGGGFAVRRSNALS